MGQRSFFVSPEFSINVFKMVEPENDKEIVPFVGVKKTIILSSLDTARFERFSSCTRLVNAITFLKQRLARYHSTKNSTTDYRSQVDFMKESETIIINAVQRNMYQKELDSWSYDTPLPKISSIIDLSPILDSNKTFRVGGRLQKAKLDTGEKTPIIIPGKSHMATLIVRHFHNYVHYQGRHITEGALRSNGFLIKGGKRLINSVLNKCVQCKKLRGKIEQQKMADLPSDRITPTPPFTCVSVDSFGPWDIISRRTRGGLAHAKRWAIMFSCLVMRGIHIEVIE